jgi:hypothetical protein
MSEPKPFASLSSGLLARKGAAKPAMRPQGFGQMGTGIEDLGWNDMGHVAPLPAEAFTPAAEEPREHVPSSIAALTPAPRLQDKGTDGAFEEAAEPPVVEQQRTIAATFATEPEPAGNDAETVPAAVVSLPRRPRKAPGSKGKAAFTLRLDPARHLKLRLACAIRHRSAQQIVSEALDEYLESLPELETLAGQLPGKAKTN